jgi:hypothetical protein
VIGATRSFFVERASEAKGQANGILAPECYSPYARSTVPIEFKAPGGLWLLCLVLPLVLLYVLKARRQRVTVSSTWLWAAVARDIDAKSPFRRLVWQLPLILELLALALFSLSLARPATRGGRLTGDHVAIVIDISASMAAREPYGNTRMAHAREAASAVIRVLGPSAQAVIIAAGRDARVVCPMDGDRRRLEAAVTQLEASDAEGRMTQAIASANTQLRPFQRGARLVVVSDGALAERDAFASSALPVEWLRVGEPVDNTGIVRLEIGNKQDPKSGRNSVQVFALIEHFGDKPRSLTVTLSQRNVSEPLVSRRIDLAPGQRLPVILEFEPARSDSGTGLIVELSPHDALPSDDRAYGRVPNGTQLQVVMAPEKGNPWVARALGSDPNVELLGTSLAGLSAAGVSPDALVVIDGACPETAPGRDLLLLNPPLGPCGSTLVRKILADPRVTSWAELDPRLRFLSLDGVELKAARQLEADSPQAILVQSDQGTLIADASSADKTKTVVGFDVGDSNWPLKASFVLFMRNVVELARSHRLHGAETEARVGEAYSLRVPTDVTEVDLETPTSRHQKLGARAGTCVIPTLLRAGFYFATYAGKIRNSSLFFANLNSERESDLRRRELPQARGLPTSPRTTGELQDSVNDWSWLLAALSLALLALDVCWATRRPHGVNVIAPLRPDRSARAAA